MRTLKLSLAFLFMFCFGMSVNTVSVSNTGFSIESSIAEAAQTTTTTTTKSTTTASGSKTKKMKVKQVDLQLVTDKSPFANFLASNNKIIRAFLVVLSVLAGIIYFIKFGLGLQQRAEDGRVKSPTSKLFVNVVVATLIMNFYRAMNWFLPSENNCDYNTFLSNECGNTAMPVTGDLLKEITGAAATNTGSDLAILGDVADVVNYGSWTVTGLGAVAFVFLLFKLDKMYSDPNERKDFSLIARMGFASAMVMNHRGIIEVLVLTAKTFGFWG